jgi:hypothetical protein
MSYLRSFHLLILLLLYVLNSNEAKKTVNPDSDKDNVQIQKFEEGGKFVFAYDNIFTKEILEAYLKLVAHGNIQGMVSPWQYAYKDYYFDVQVANSSNNAPWISPIQPYFFTKTAVWKEIQKATQQVSGGKLYYPRDVSVSMVRRLDFTRVDTGKRKNNSVVYYANSLHEQFHPKFTYRTAFL